MKPVNFPEANSKHGPPKGFDESQIMTIPSFTSESLGGHLDGCGIVVVAWQPSDQEIKAIAAGGNIFLTMIGGLAPHFVSTSFKDAIQLG